MASYGLVSGGRSLRANDWRKASFGGGRGGNGSYKTQENLRAASTFVYILTTEPGFAQIQGI